MKFYTISTDYVSFLKTVDARVPNTQDPAYQQQKIFVGVVLEIDGHKYLAPLTSYKPHQDKIKSSSPVSFKLHEKSNPDNKLGMINLKFMIPVLDSQIQLLDINSISGGYQRMLYKQLEFIRVNKSMILKKAELLRHLVIDKEQNFGSCNFALLEEKYRSFI